MKDIKEIGPKGKKGVPWSFWDDCAELCTKVPKDERQTGPLMWQEFYGDMWPDDPSIPANAQKMYHIVGQWAFDAWDEAKNLPGELFIESVHKAQYNTWATNGDYIFDSMAEGSAGGTTINSAAKGTQFYRPKPNEPGYTGPYTTHVKAPT